VAKRPGGTPALLALEREGVGHTVHEIPAVPGDLGYARAAVAALEVDAARVFKTLVAVVDDQPHVAVVPSSAQLSLKSLAAAVGGKRAAMAEPALAERVTGYVVGGISPLGQKRRLPTVLDDTAARFSTVFVSAGRRGLDIQLATADLVRLTGAVVAPIRA
jgi:Cys-tRNA(Pro)/Cys-tRNA(Cys) deacylase